jgi:hypothetical protein
MGGAKRGSDQREGRGRGTNPNPVSHARHGPQLTRPSPHFHPLVAPPRGMRREGFPRGEGI